MNSNPVSHRFAKSGEQADICVIIVNYNTSHLLERCIENLRAASSSLRVRVIIVDNASRDGSADFVRQAFADCILFANSENVGFGRANNQALKYSDAPYLLLLNTDAFVFPDTLTSSLRHMEEQPACGILGVQLLSESGIPYWPKGRSFPGLWQDFLARTGLHREVSVDVPEAGFQGASASFWSCDWVVGCYYFVRYKLVDEVGLFDPRYFLYFEEVDHCRAARQAGWRVDCLANTAVIHEGGASAESEGELSTAGRQISSLQIESQLLYFRKHGGLSGLVTAVFLELLANAIQAFKWAIRGRGMKGLGVFAKDSATVCNLAFATRLGRRPTR